MIEYWHWHTLHFGTETYWGGVLPHSQQPGRVYDELAGLGRQLAAIGTRLDDYVPDADIAANDAVFSILDLKGHVYYAPTYMVWFIRTGYDTDSNSVEAAQRAFNPWGKTEGGRRYRPHEMFSPEQCACIAQYLHYVDEVLDGTSGGSTAREYLDAYWAQFL